ncbi:MAG: glycosyltransferase family 39 protein, partial [Promethearchaeota archaeon]
MKNIDKKVFQKIVFFVGIMIFIIGLIVNSLPPSEIKRENSEGFTLAQDEYRAIHLNPELTSNEYEFNIYFFTELDGQANCSVVFLLNSEYLRFLDEGSMENVSIIYVMDSQYDTLADSIGYFGTFSITASDTVYVLFINLGEATQVFNYGYYYSISTPSFFYGVILMLLGTVIAFSVVICYLKGWKRYLSIGICINSCVFLIRIAVLPLNFSETFEMTSIWDLLHPEMYRDFEAYYIGWAELFKNGVFPYSPQYYYYAYGPLFIITIGIFALLPFPIWSVAIPLYLSNIATGYLIYLISRKLTDNEKYSIYAMMLYFFNPFTLMYSSFSWLNSSLFVFFIILSYYLALESKHKLSMVSLGIAVMYKQFALVFFPLILLLAIKNEKETEIKKKLKHFLLFSSIFCSTILLISLPFLIANFNSYVNGYIISTFYSIDYFFINPIYIGRSVNFTTFFALIGSPEFIILGLGYLLIYYVLLGGSNGIIYLSYLKYQSSERINKKRTLDPSLFAQAIYLSIFIVLSFQLFYPRG